jgi:hypothetical protein
MRRSPQSSRWQSCRGSGDLVHALAQYPPLDPDPVTAEMSLEGRAYLNGNLQLDSNGD